MPLVFAVRRAMMLARFLRVMDRVEMMAVGDVGVMTGLLVIPRFVVLRGLQVMLRGLLVVGCRLFVVLGTFVGRRRRGHGEAPSE